jgi:glycosyltransferase involved in cell wall biosynthesis
MTVRRFEMMEVVTPSTAAATSTVTLENQPILSFDVNPWDGIWFSRQHLLSRLARLNPVLYVTSPFYIRDALQGVWRGEGRATGVSKIGENLYTYAPPRWLPYNYRSQPLNQTTERLRVRQIQKALDKLGMKRPILYIWHPSFAGMIGHFDESLVVYHCYDEYIDFPGITAADRERIQAQEEAILSRADIVFTASSSIYERKRRANANTHIMRNGVDYSLMATAQDAETPIPADLLAIPRPVIGCVTRIVEDYFDLGLMHEVFTKRPDWSLVVVGPEATMSGEKKGQLEALRKLPNVFLLGRRRRESVPGYLKGFDVCLIAYPVIDVVLHTESPLKMMEYLAAGKPIVSPRLPLLSELSSVINFAGTTDEWIEAIQSALSEDASHKVRQRQAIARESSWDRKAAIISVMLGEELARRNGPTRPLLR